MGFGAFTHYIDIPQMVLYVFWIFFAGLIYYLRREDKREGYPLEPDRGGTVRVEGFPAVPPPKTFKLPGGTTYQAPPGKPEWREIRTKATLPTGSPQQPTGDPMLDAVGPASYAEREDKPERMNSGEPLIVPMRVAVGFSVATEDSDPRGMAVVAADGVVAGKVSEIWVDRAEPQIRYLEVSLALPAGSGRTVLLPITYARISKRKRRINVVSILARHFAKVPGIASPDQVTLLEEDRITAYYAGGHLYAEPSRMGPIV
jgi:photosynthetic reaction center H subunit